MVLLVPSLFFLSCTINDSDPFNDTKKEVNSQNQKTNNTNSTKLYFSGYSWDVESGNGKNPGNNNWSKNNAWVDAKGKLHLRITKNKGKWYCAQVSTTEYFRFGKYEWFVEGRIDKLDKNVVLGLFNYPDPNVGKDGTNEIDIEFAKWGKTKNDIGNYTVYPAIDGLKKWTYPFSVKLQGNYTTHRFTWSSKKVIFQSLHGWTSDDKNQIKKKTYTPSKYKSYIPQNSERIFINLWLYKDENEDNPRPPNDGKEVEIIISKFSVY